MGATPEAERWERELEEKAEYVVEDAASVVSVKFLRCRQYDIIVFSSGHLPSLTKSWDQSRRHQPSTGYGPKLMKPKNHNYH
jgi:hypothetical protein